MGLDADPLDHAHPDVGDAPRADAPPAPARRRRRLMQLEDDADAGGAAQAQEEQPATSDVAAAEAFENFRADSETWDDGVGAGGAGGIAAEEGGEGGAFPYGEGYDTDTGAFDPYHGSGADEDAAGGIRPPREYAHEGAYDAVASAASRARADAPPAPPQPDAATDAEEPEEPQDPYYSDDYGGWGSQEWRAGGAGGDAPEEGMILVDAHVLCSPTLADLDGDGTPELLVAVSYFFDKEVRAGAMSHHSASASQAFPARI